MYLPAIQKLLSHISYKDWAFHCGMVGEDHFYLQIRFKDGQETWSGRKWLLSQHMTESEIYQTALKAVLTAEEHEAREKFLVGGRAIFGPHIHHMALANVCDHLDVR